MSQFIDLKTGKNGASLFLHTIIIYIIFEEGKFISLTQEPKQFVQVTSLEQVAKQTCK